MRERMAAMEQDHLAKHEGANNNGTLPLEVQTVDARRPKPTDDELGDRLIERWAGRYAFFFGAWQEYSAGVWRPAPKLGKEIWELLKIAKREGIRPTDSKVNSIEKYLQMMLMVDDDLIDASRRYINLRNGLYNLDTEMMEPHRPDLYTTSQLPFAYDPEAVCPVFQKFLYDVLRTTDGKFDHNLELVVREAFGYSLTADTSQRVSFWLVGESSTGKSTLLDVLIALAGDSHVAIDLDQLGQSAYQVADVAGKRVVTFTEPDSRSVLADSVYKRLVSQDVMSARQIFGKPFRFVPIAKVWGAMNDTPRVIDRSDAIYSRVIILPMNVRIPREKWDMDLNSKLRAELAGIFNWTLSGLKRLRMAGNFTRCDQVENARAQYKEENDTEMAFFRDCIQFNPDKAIQGQGLYDAYATWCKRNGVMAKSSTKVSKDWQRLGLRRKRVENGTVYVGAELTAMGLRFAGIDPF